MILPQRPASAGSIDHGVMTLWTAPRKGRPFERYEALMMSLSSNLARLRFKRLTLYTDDAGARVCERLLFPFTDICVELNDYLPNLHHIWAAGKLYAYRRQTEPFLHMDWDVLWWDRPPLYVLNAPFFVQSEESREGRNANRHTAYRVQEIQLEAATRLWTRHQATGSLKAFNVGIIGGTNTAFIQEWADEVLYMLAHPLNLEVLRVACGTVASLLFEQWYLAAKTLEAGLGVTVLLPDNETEEQAAAVRYTHLICGSKRRMDVRESVEREIRSRFPDAWERCIALS